MTIHEQLIYSADDTFQDHRQATDAESCFDQERIKVEDQIKNQKLVFSLVGNVNSGKSSTINALTGMDIASVHPIPGHTKHVSLYRMPRFPQVLVADTPGLEDVNEEVSARARDFVEADSDIILFFINATVGVTASELKAYFSLRSLGRPMLVVMGKSDLLEDNELSIVVDHTLQTLDLTDQPHTLIPISPKNGKGIPELTEAMAKILAASGKDLLFAKLTREKDRIVDLWIKGAAAAAFAIGALPIPGSDTVPLTALQVGLTMKISVAYGIEITREAVLPLMTEMAAGRIGKMVFRTLLKAVGWLGGPVGEFVTAGIAGVLAASMTYGIGMAAKHYFKNGMHETMDELQKVFQDATEFYRNASEGGIE